MKRYSFVFMVVSFLLLLFCRDNFAQKKFLPLVSVFSVKEMEINIPLEYVGHVEPVKEVDIVSRVQGFIERINFKEGGFVKPDQVLYVIEQAPYKAEVRAKEAEVKMCEAELDRAEKRLNRLKAAGEQSVSATDLDRAEADFLKAKAALLAAKAKLEMAKINLDYTIIRSPISGRVGKTRFTEGNFVTSASGTLLKVIQIDPIRVVFCVSENHISVLKRLFKKDSGFLVLVKLSDGTIYRHKGRIEFMDNRIDPSTGTISVWAIFNNPEKLLIPGQFVTVLLKEKRSKKVCVIPQSTVLRNRFGAYVFLVDKENKIAIRQIRLGKSIGIYFAVKSGLKPGDQVVVGGIQKVRPGQKVITRAYIPPKGM